jgi:glycosyltransferase involved in cell wall biosynthesis
MKILMWLPAGFMPAIGGLESFTETLAKELIAAGHQVSVFAFEHYPSFLPYELVHGIEIFRFPSIQLLQGKEQLQTYKTLSNAMKQLSPDILHLQFTASANLMFFFLLLKTLKMPLVVTTHGLFDDLSKHLYQRVAERANHIICVSKYLLDESHQYLVNTRAKLSFIYNGIRITDSLFSLISFKPPRLLCLGRFTAEKGYDLAIKAYAMILKNHPQTQLTLVGAGVEKDNLQTLARHCGVADNVSFLPPLNSEQCLRIINESSIVLIPSRYESFGLVAIEAGMLGRPVIASDVGGLPEIIKSGETGVLVQKENINDLHASIDDLLTHPHRALQMGKTAYAHIRKHFSAQCMLAEYEKIYETVRLDGNA